MARVIAASGAEMGFGVPRANNKINPAVLKPSESADLVLERSGLLATQSK